MVVDATVPSNRAQVQGTIDVVVALVGASGGITAGLIVAATSYGMLSLGGGVLALTLIPVMHWVRRQTCTVSPASSTVPSR